MAPFTEEQIEFLEEMFKSLNVKVEVRGWSGTTRHIDVELRYTNHERGVDFSIDSSTDEIEVGEMNKVDYPY